MQGVSVRLQPDLLVFAFCLLHFALLSCTKASPATAPATTTARLALDQLRRDITQATQAPGVQRGVWGIVVHSLDRNERLFELQPRTLLVPASVAKLAAVATAAEAVGWDYQYETTLEATGPIVDGVLVRRSPGHRLRRSDDRRPRRRGFLELDRRAARRRASVASTAGSSAMTTPSKSRGRSWRGPGTTSATRAARCSGRSTTPRTG